MLCLGVVINNVWAEDILKETNRSKEALVSVIIPAYNHEQFIQETIGSIIAQTYENIELIVIDDGSKDSTWNKINELKETCEERFTRVHFETQENEGTV